jgi:hypothetical protein
MEDDGIDRTIWNRDNPAKLYCGRPIVITVSLGFAEEQLAEFCELELPARATKIVLAHSALNDLPDTIFVSYHTDQELAQWFKACDYFVTICNNSEHELLAKEAEACGAMIADINSQNIVDKLIG